MTARPIVAAWLLLLGGCAAVRPAERPVTMRLAPAAPARAASLLPAPFAVAPVQARGLAGALRYDYVDAAAPAEIRQAKTLFWEEPPIRVIERALIDALRSRYANVSGADISQPGARRVIAELDRFEETGAGGVARATVAFAISVTGPTLSTGRYCASIPITGTSGTARARAFEAAIRETTEDFVQDMASGRLSARAC
jgi:ABC-type uncharacterized transport system auxiliary subunit